MARTPDIVLNNMIKLYKYKGIKCKKIDNDTYTLDSYNEIPKILHEFVLKSYNVIFCSDTYLEFHEFFPIGLEILNSKSMF